MKRLALLFAVLPSLAWAQSSPNWPSGYRPSAQETNAEWASKRDYAPNPQPSKSILYAVDYGVQADGVHSDDVQLGNAITACSTLGAMLVLPPGQILLNGAATISLQNCSILGSGVPAGFTTTASLGTVIELTSTSVQPFIVGSNWSVNGVNFFWPNQINGLTVYPPLFTDAGSQIAHVYIDNVTIVNAYDGFIQTPTSNWGDFKFSNSTMYAVHRMFKVGTTGDSWTFSNMRFTPGPWFNMVPGTSGTAVYAADLVNALFEIAAGSNVTILMGTTVTFAWRYGVLVDAGAVFGGGDMDVEWDGTGTIVDSSSGGLFTSMTMRGGNSPCFVPTTGGGSFGNWPCFKLGANSSIILNGYGGGARGDFIQAASAAQIKIQNGGFGPLAQAKDGGEYYFINVVAGSPDIIVQGNYISGDPADVHAHGIHTGTNISSRLVIQDNGFLYLNDILDIRTSPNTTTITGNWSTNTTGSASLLFSGTDGITYAANAWDKPPLATVSACGAGATITGTLSGVVFVGSTNPTTACSITFPFNPLAGGVCAFTPSIAVVIAGGPSGAPPTWSLVTSGDIHGAQLFYNCTGRQ